MKAALLSVALLYSTAPLLGQGPFSIDDGLRQLYHDYDPTKKTAHWMCTEEQHGEASDRICQYLMTGNLKDDATVSVSVLLTAQVPEGDVTRIYLATSAKPARFPGEFDCHACIPAIGAAVYAWQGERWALEGANVAADYAGGWGESARVDLVTIGPKKHGLLLSSTDMGQGYVAAFKQLLAPLGKSFEEIWSLEDDDDDSGTIDPDDKTTSKPVCRASAALRFLADDETVNGADANGKSNYYDIEVISRGSSWQDYNHPPKRENWTSIYTFKDGKYVLSHKTVFSEVRSPGRAIDR